MAEKDFCQRQSQKSIRRCQAYTRIHVAGNQNREELFEIPHTTWSVAEAVFEVDVFGVLGTCDQCPPLWKNDFRVNCLSSTTVDSSS